MHKIAALMLPLAFALPLMAADNPFDAEARAKAIAPFLDTQTIALAHVDVTRLDVEGFVAILTDVMNLTADEVGPLKQAAQQWTADFKQAGGKEVYVVASLDDLPQHLSLVVPIGGGANARGLQELLGGKRSAELARYLPCTFGIETIERMDGALFAGSKAALGRLRGSKPALRPEVTKAFTATGDTVAQLLLLPAAGFRRAIEEIIPKLPDEVGGGSSTIMTHGLLWAAVGVDGPPKASVRLVVQSQDGASANSFGALLANASKTFGRDKNLRRSVPKLDEILALLSPIVKADQLTLSVDPKEEGTARFLTALAPLAMQPVRRNQCAENLRRMGIALHTYHDVHNQFPAQANFDATGKPLLSWRVHILPYLGEEKLYKEFHLNEPWNSEHNKKLVARMPAVYRCPSMPRSLRNKTTYLAPVNELAIFTGAAEGVPVKEVKDGTSNTVFIVDADDEHAVIWTEPADLKYDPKDPRKGIAGHHDGLIATLFVDGSIRFVSDTIDDKTLLAIFTRNGGEHVVIP